MKGDSSDEFETERRIFGGPCLRRVESGVFAINSTRSELEEEGMGEMVMVACSAKGIFKGRGENGKEATKEDGLGD